MKQRRRLDRLGMVSVLSEIRCYDRSCTVPGESQSANGAGCREESYRVTTARDADRRVDGAPTARVEETRVAGVPTVGVASGEREVGAGGEAVRVGGVTSTVTFPL